MRKWSVLLCLLSWQVQAKTLDLKLENRSIYIEEQRSWELKRELFGMPFLYFSPQVNGQRSNISFTDTGADVQLDVNALEKSQDKYQAVKEKWATSVNAKVVSFIPYKSFKNKLGHKVHRIGVSYEHEELTYIEKSFYIECRGRIIFAKGLRLAKNVQHDKEFNDLIEKLDCGGL